MDENCLEKWEKQKTCKKGKKGKKSSKNYVLQVNMFREEVRTAKVKIN